MEAGGVTFIQETLRGFLKCLGLEAGGGNTFVGGEEVVNNHSSPLSLSVPTDVAAASATADEPLRAVDDTSRTTDPLFDVLSLPIDNTATATTDVNNNLGTDRSVTLVTLDEVIKTSGGTTAEAHYVELLAGGQPKMSLLTTSLISSGGGGKTH